MENGRTSQIHKQLINSSESKVLKSMTLYMCGFFFFFLETPMLVLESLGEWCKANVFLSSMISPNPSWPYFQALICLHDLGGWSTPTPSLSFAKAAFASSLSHRLCPLWSTVTPSHLCLNKASSPFLADLAVSALTEIQCLQLGSHSPSKFSLSIWRLPLHFISP